MYHEIPIFASYHVTMVVLQWWCYNGGVTMMFEIQPLPRDHYFLAVIIKHSLITTCIAIFHKAFDCILMHPVYPYY